MCLKVSECFSTRIFSAHLQVFASQVWGCIVVTHFRNLSMAEMWDAISHPDDRVEICPGKERNVRGGLFWIWVRHRVLIQKYVTPQPVKE